MSKKRRPRGRGGNNFNLDEGPPEVGSKFVGVSSMYGYRSRKALVSLTFDPDLNGAFCMAPNEARDLAWNLIAAAEAAEGDAFLFEFAQKCVGTDEVGAAKLVNEFRQFRR